MLKKCTKGITDWLIRCGVVDEVERELYEYAMYSVFLTISPVLLATCFGILFGAVLRSILIILPFFVIRKFSGGYHAKRAGTCLVSSSLLLVLCIVLSFRISCGWLLLFITALSAVSLGHFSPLENQNRLLSDEERIYYKKVTIALVGSFSAVGVLFFCLQMCTYVVCISMGLILSAGLQFPCILAKLLENGHNY